jgi:hypothetical protein
METWLVKCKLSTLANILFTKEPEKVKDCVFGEPVSVVDPDPVGSGHFGPGRIRNRIRKSRSGSGSENRSDLTDIKFCIMFVYFFSGLVRLC